GFFETLDLSFDRADLRARQLYFFMEALAPFAVLVHPILELGGLLEKDSDLLLTRFILSVEDGNAFAGTGQSMLGIANLRVELGDTFFEFTQLTFPREDAALRVMGSCRERSIRLEDIAVEGDETMPRKLSSDFSGSPEVANNESLAQEPLS